jgi:UDP-galactopyranose mutase
MCPWSYQSINKWPGEDSFDFLVVGAGLSGAVMAERIATVWNKRCLVIDKRDHIGGNCYDYRNKYGILMNKYGAHLFHTNYDRVWDYIRKFSDWVRWEHCVLAYVDKKYVSIPVNITTVNRLCEENIENEKEMNEWLAKTQVKYDHEPANGAEMAKSRVGEILYDKLFKDYTYKQWNRYPEELDASVLARIPVRNNFDTRYFSDRYQALPKYGYTAFFEKVLCHPNIQVMLNCNFFEFKKDVIASGKPIIYTGPIDQYFSDSGLPALQYRSIEFTEENFENMQYFQPNSVVNYPSTDVPFTRIVEYKHFLSQESPHTTIVKEVTKESGEPYYPVPNEQNMALYSKYKQLADKEEGIHFLGRLANYKYFNMDQAINNALEFFDEMCQNKSISKE